MQNVSSRRTFRLATLALAAMLACALALVAFQPSAAFAVVSSVKTAEVTPSYPNPITGEIEDPGDPSMVAMAESMMEGVTFPYALVETDVDGNVFVSLRFNLADQENGVTMEASVDGTEYVAAPGEMVASNAENNTADWRFQVPEDTQYLRSHLGVIPIDREVIYFLTLGNSIDGNSANFTQTVTPGEGAEEPEPAAAADEPAESAATAAEPEPATTDDAAPATSESADEGIAEYNAEGRDVTGVVDEQSDLDGGAIALIIAIAAAIAAGAGIVVFVAYVHPKRARQAAAAAAAAGAGASVPHPAVVPAAQAKTESAAESSDEQAKDEDPRA